MKPQLLLISSLAVGMLLASCSGKKGDNVQTSLDSSAIGTPNEKPYADSEQQNSNTVKLGGKTYVVTIHRKADPSLPTMKDEYDKTYYDNRVDVKITCEGKEFFSKSYTKDSFAERLTSAEIHENLLLGMAYNPTRSDAHAIYLGAQIGQIGIGEGPAFCIEIPLNGDAPKISREKNQDTMGEDAMGD